MDSLKGVGIVTKRRGALQMISYDWKLYAMVSSRDSRQDLFLKSNKGVGLKLNHRQMKCCVYFLTLNWWSSPWGALWHSNVSRKVHLSESAPFGCSAHATALYYHNDDSVLFSTTPSCPILSQSSAPMPSPLLPSPPASPSTVLSFITLSCRLLFLDRSIIPWPLLSSFQIAPVPAVTHFLSLLTQPPIAVSCSFSITVR